MDKKLKNAIQWSLYVLVIIIALVTFLSLGIIVLQPTFFATVKIDGFKNYINTSCVFLSFLSVGLGIYSIWQASASGKQANDMINSIQDLKKQQEMFLVTLKNTNDIKVTVTGKSESSWDTNEVTE